MAGAFGPGFGAGFDGETLSVPVLQIRTSPNTHKRSEHSAVQSKSGHLTDIKFPVRERGKVVHILISSYRAGRPWAPLFFIAEKEQKGVNKAGDS